MPKLKKKLLISTRRVFPTATRLILHARLDYPLRQLTDSLSAYDDANRVLEPLRPEELPELHSAIREAHGGGFLRLELSA